MVRQAVDLLVELGVKLGERMRIVQVDAFAHFINDRLKLAYRIRSDMFGCFLDGKPFEGGP
jgi:hypothetical protein